MITSNTPTSSNTNMRKIIILVVVVLVVLVAGFFITKALTHNFGRDPQQPEKLVTYPSDEFSYPPAWATRPFVQGDKDAGVTAKLSRANPNVNLVIRTQPSPQEKVDINQTMRDVVSKLQEDVSNLKVTGQKVTAIDGQKAIQIDYTQNGGDSSTVNEMFIIPLVKDTYYLTYSSDKDISSVASDIRTINQNYVKHIGE